MQNRNRNVITAPVVGSTTWSFDAASFSTANYVVVPDAWKDAVLEFYADGEGFVFGFGDSSLSTVAAGTSTSLTGGREVDVQGSIGFKLADGMGVLVDLSRVEAPLKERLVILALTGTADNELRVTRVDGYVR